MSLTTDIIDFWFEGVDDSVKIQKKRMPFRKWFRSTPQFDEEIRQRFEQSFQTFIADPGPDLDARDKLAGIILCDQLSRNMFRHSPEAFLGDMQAQRLAIELIRTSEDRALYLIHRVFVYMPLMHAEDLSLQCQSVNSFTQLVEDSSTINPENTGYYQSQLDHARKYYNIIKQYGRFPHRNKILGRTSTAAELEFLS